jgi:hypothetical protein
MAQRGETSACDKLPRLDSSKDRHDVLPHPVCMTHMRPAFRLGGIDARSISRREFSRLL